MRLKMGLVDYVLLLVTALTPLHFMWLYININSYSGGSIRDLWAWGFAITPSLLFIYFIVTRSSCPIPAKVTAFLAAYVPITFIISRTYSLDTPLSENFGLWLTSVAWVAVPCS